MKSQISILTYRRLGALQATLEGIEKHCPQYSLCIFEDCGNRDATADFLQKGRKADYRPDLLAYEYKTQDGIDCNLPNARVFIGSRNLGVAGNSNRAIKVFMEGDWDHLCLCNDDLHVKGDFVNFYGKAHQDLGVGLWAFCDFDGPSYKWTTYPWRGYKIKFLPRFTGIMMSFTRKLLDKIGYFDAVFGTFGQEHCDFTIRARLAGGIRIEKQDMHCLDLEHELLQHQDVVTSVVGPARKAADKEADQIMAECSKTYRNTHYYRPFRLKLPRTGGAYRGGGIPIKNLLACGYQLVTDLV